PPVVALAVRPLDCLPVLPFTRRHTTRCPHPSRMDQLVFGYALPRVRGRLMARRQPLELVIKVRVFAPQLGSPLDHERPWQTPPASPSHPLRGAACARCASYRVSRSVERSP